MPTTKKHVLLTSGKRKTAIARAITKLGKGSIRINKVPVEQYTSDITSKKLMEPLILTGDFVKELDINVEVRGGGFMSQAEAARMAIARAIYRWSKGTKVKKTFIAYDRMMIAGDPRRKEPKKFGGPGARRRKQKSYR